MQKIFNFFPLTVYKSTLSLSENEKNEMIELLASKNVEKGNLPPALQNCERATVSTCTALKNNGKPTNYFL